MIQKSPSQRNPFAQNLSRKLPSIFRMELSPYATDWAEHLHVPEHNEILHIVQGHMELETRQGSFAAGPGDTLLVRAGWPHRDRFNPADPLVVFLCHFEWSLTKPFFERVDNPLLRAIPAAGKAELALIFDQLRAMLVRASEADIQSVFKGYEVRTWGPLPADIPVANARLLTLLLLILKYAGQNETTQPRQPEIPRRPFRAQELIAKAEAYIAAHYARPIGLRDTAAGVGTSPCHLSHVYSRESEFSFAAHLREVRLAKAQKLLTEEAFSVGNVARAVGFRYPNYFAKVFRKRFGLSPIEYAAAHAQRQSAPTRHPR